MVPTLVENTIMIIMIEKQYRADPGEFKEFVQQSKMAQNKHHDAKKPYRPICGRRFSVC